MSSVIMHIDMDAFFASVEQRVNPRLRGKPVIVGGRNNRKRSIVCAASYEAKAYGISSGMPAWKAYKLCPQAEFVAADTAKYLYTSGNIFELLKSFSPKVEKHSIDEFFMSVAGSEGLFRSAEDIGREIKKKVYDEFGITCSVGIAPTMLSAKLAAKIDKPDGLMSLNKEQALQRFYDLPIQKICGIGNRLQQRFNRLGIFTCGELASYPDDVLQYHFGKVGLWLKAAAKIEDVGSIGYYEDGDDPPKSVGHSQTLRTVSDNVDYIHSWIYLLSEMVGQRLRKKALQGRTVNFYFSDGFEAGYSKQKTFSDATFDGFEIYQRGLHILSLIGISHLQVRVMAMSVSHLEPIEQNYLFERQTKRVHLLKSQDQINNKWGEWTIYPASLEGAQY